MRTDLSECGFVTLDSRTPHVVPSTGSEANPDTIGTHFMGRWQNTRGEKGPVCETVSATVPG